MIEAFMRKSEATIRWRSRRRACHCCGTDFATALRHEHYIVRRRHGGDSIDAHFRVRPLAPVTSSSRRCRPTAVNSATATGRTTGETTGATAVASTAASTGATTGATISTTTLTLLMVPMPAELCAFAAAHHTTNHHVPRRRCARSERTLGTHTVTALFDGRRPGTGLRGN
jgi:hypothetical protein